MTDSNTNTNLKQLSTDTGEVVGNSGDISEMIDHIDSIKFEEASAEEIMNKAALPLEVDKLNNTLHLWNNLNKYKYLSKTKDVFYKNTEKKND